MTQHNTAPNLPQDLLSFLRAGRQLEYDIAQSEAGRVKLKRESELTLTTIETFPGRQSFVSDPYMCLEGVYQTDVYDLVAKCEHYRCEGLLCWIVALKCFGCIDPEHGDITTFPQVTWTDIVARPVPYLNVQWGAQGVAAVSALPWLHFPFRLRKTEAVIAPYGPRCALHDSPITRQAASKPPLFELLQRRFFNVWFEYSTLGFPHGGVPVTASELLCCAHCRTAEDSWVQEVVDAIPIADATPNAHGWIKCPGCGTRFTLSDRRAFADDMCMKCAQRINVVDTL